MHLPYLCLGWFNVYTYRDKFLIMLIAYGLMKTHPVNDVKCNNKTIKHYYNNYKKLWHKIFLLLRFVKMTWLHPCYSPPHQWAKCYSNMDLFTELKAINLSKLLQKKKCFVCKEKYLKNGHLWWVPFYTWLK